MEINDNKSRLARVLARPLACLTGTQPPSEEEEDRHELNSSENLIRTEVIRELIRTETPPD